MLAVGVLLAVQATGRAEAADWGGISPGRTMMNDVRGLYGGPTRTVTQRIDNFDGQQWIYEGPKAPSGLQRMVVDFGLLRGTFRPDLVRTVTLEPRPGIFNVDIVLQGWGRPDRESPEGQPIAFFYESGLLVNFAQDGRAVTSLIFTPPQGPTPAPASGSTVPRR